MENYQSFNDSLISNYLSIIIDVISIINSGMNQEYFVNRVKATLE
jgi:hypothetical protein